MKKVLIVLPHFRTGGGQQLAIDEAIELNNMAEFDVTIMSLCQKEDNIFTHKIEFNNLHTVYLSKKEGYHIPTFFTVIKKVFEMKPDIVHTHLLALAYFLPVSIVYRKAKYFHTVHSVAEKEATGIFRKIENACYKIGRFVPVAISDYCAKTIAHLYGMSIDRIPIIYNGISTERFKCVVPYSERDKKIITFISTGRMEEVKRHTLMIQAFAEVHKSFSNTELIFLGDGPLRKNVEIEIERQKLKESVILKGVVDNVQEELNKAHIYLMCSQYEGLPLSVLAAMSCGLPVIATKAGGTVDVVNSRTGIICDVDNKNQIIEAMLQLCADENLRRDMSKNALIESVNFSDKKCAEGYAKLFCED